MAYLDHEFAVYNRRRSIALKNRKTDRAFLWIVTAVKPLFQDFDHGLALFDGGILQCAAREAPHI